MKYDRIGRSSRVGHREISLMTNRSLTTIPPVSKQRPKTVFVFESPLC